jgi:hypothetical protein
MTLNVKQLTIRIGTQNAANSSFHAARHVEQAAHSAKQGAHSMQKVSRSMQKASLGMTHGASIYSEQLATCSNQ